MLKQQYKFQSYKIIILACSKVYLKRWLLIRPISIGPILRPSSTTHWLVACIVAVNLTVVDIARLATIWRLMLLKGGLAGLPVTRYTYTLFDFSLFHNTSLVVTGCGWLLLPWSSCLLLLARRSFITRTTLSKFSISTWIRRGGTSSSFSWYLLFSNGMFLSVEQILYNYFPKYLITPLIQ